jgi:hypothetical protein
LQVQAAGNGQLSFEAYEAGIIDGQLVDATLVGINILWQRIYEEQSTLPSNGGFL